MFHSPEISQVIVCLILDVLFHDFGVLCDCVRCVHPPTSKVTRLSVSKNRNQDKLSDLHHRDWLRHFSPYLGFTLPSEMTYCTNCAPTGTIPSCTLWFMYSLCYPNQRGCGQRRFVHYFVVFDGSSSDEKGCKNRLMWSLFKTRNVKFSGVQENRSCQSHTQAKCTT